MNHFKKSKLLLWTGFFFVGVLLGVILAYTLRTTKTVNSTTSPSHFTVHLQNGTSDIMPNQPTVMVFQIYADGNGKPVTALQTLYEKLIHVIVVDSSLTTFNHVHPVRAGDNFSLTYTFPKAGVYLIYFNYQPLGQPEQVNQIQVAVGGKEALLSKQPVDTNLSKVFNDVQVALTSNGPLSAEKLNQGKQVLTFTIKEAKTGRSVVDLEPYLGAFGHLTMINQVTHDYIHIHPNQLRPPQERDRQGPNVQFLPMTMSMSQTLSTITPGTYRVFAEFKRGQVFVVDFTVRVL